MIKIPARYQILEKRLLFGLSQRELGLKCGLPRTLICKFESGDRMPTARHWALLSEALGLAPVCFVEPSGWTRALTQRKVDIYFPTLRRPMHVRIFKARERCPQIVDPILARINKRADSHTLWAFLSRIPADSYLEALYALGLLDRGACLMAVVPYGLDAFPCPIVNPDNRAPVGQKKHLCLYLDGAYYFFQISLRPKGLWTVDVLVWNGRWYVLELDGAGHDVENDTSKESAIPLPFIRWKSNDVKAFASKQDGTTNWAA